MKRKSQTKPRKPSAKDALVAKAAKNGDVELKEDELARVSGGLIALLHKDQ